MKKNLSSSPKKEIDLLRTTNEHLNASTGFKNAWSIRDLHIKNKRQFSYE